jgi:phospholipid-binding lipoprotein MlaA
MRQENTQEGGDLDFIEELNDPLEPLNRSIYFLNLLVDGAIIKPLAIAYRLVLPHEVRHGVGNVLTNLGTPIAFLNHFLQGSPSRAGTTFMRFCLNSTLGIGGIFDPAKEMGFPCVQTTFNETLAVWGIKTGPYLFLPIIGPSSMRDVVGLGADYSINPLHYLLRRQKNHQEIVYTITGGEVIHQRNLLLETLDDLEATSLDMYASLRSIYFQKQVYFLKKFNPVEEALSDSKIPESP